MSRARGLHTPVGVEESQQPKIRSIIERRRVKYQNIESYSLLPFEVAWMNVIIHAQR
jgi:hypothetical protein